MGILLWLLFIIVLIVWLVGFLALRLAGGLIHLLLIVALVLLIINLAGGARRKP